MAVAAHARGRQAAGLARYGLSRQAHRCLSAGPSTPSTQARETTAAVHGNTLYPPTSAASIDSVRERLSTSSCFANNADDAPHRRAPTPTNIITSSYGAGSINSVVVTTDDVGFSLGSRTRSRLCRGIDNDRRAVSRGTDEDGERDFGLPRGGGVTSRIAPLACHGGRTPATGSSGSCIADGWVCTSGVRWRARNTGGEARWGLRGVGGVGVGRGEAIGTAWRGFASATSPSEPEQYLRYIHRVAPEESEEVNGLESAPDNDQPRYSLGAEGGAPGGGGERPEDNGSASTSATQSSTVQAPAPAVEGDHAGGRRETGNGKAGEKEEGGELPAGEITRRWLKGFKAEDILRDKTLLRQQLEIPGNCTVDEAVTAFVNEQVTSFVVVNRRKEVIGMFTSRDLLAALARYPDKADGLKTKAHEFMIPLSQMIYCSPKDSLYQCLLVMSELKVRNLPVVSEGKVMGIVNVNDISDFSFSMEELGGKKAYIKNISQRKGLPKGVGLDSRQHPSGWKQAFSASVGAVALPHPHKLPNGRVSATTREHRHLEVAEDSTLSEDAHFVLDVTWPTPTTDTVHYMGIADGVGSWRRVGVDPREFSHRLMHWAHEYILNMAPGNGIGAHMVAPPPKPHQVLQAAWEYTIGEKVVGSSTACVAALDYDLEQLTFSNIGDCGVVVLRHIDSDVAGYMREKKTPRHLRDSDLRLAFISQQQLRSFNLPYQFGYTNVPEDNANFETPRDAVNTSFPVRAGDIILLATDGLFDNMELDDICAVALNWEYKWFGGPMEGLSDHNNAAMDDLAEQLGHRARELSLDNTRDSPFALLAKENDIMWGGGMPDDITVVALRVINKAQSSADVVSKRGVGPDDQHADEAA